MKRTIPPIHLKTVKLIDLNNMPANSSPNSVKKTYHWAFFHFVNVNSIRDSFLKEIVMGNNDKAFI